MGQVTFVGHCFAPHTSPREKGKELSAVHLPLSLLLQCGILELGTPWFWCAKDSGFHLHRWAPVDKESGSVSCTLRIQWIEPLMALILLYYIILY